ncbi:hypothetical protein [Hymenobacter volaticus]|uniref:Secreted protein n=1 Tax=Hymenobacter volaticus TaxID=2932254 RepID=A0ABY4GDI0_9BACT|nr:hypothetical protein [Hymenobacter volaticus]UOQ68840.1 hypothetical protein MUN86_25575 [Hymenobacter volaticus]
MRQAVAILLLCSLSVHCAGRLGIVANWWLNRDYVARVLCINRDKPAMHCNGKCHLAKRLRAAAATEQQQRPLGSKQAFQEITLFCAPVFVLRVLPPAAFRSALPQYAVLHVCAYNWDRPGPDHPPAEQLMSTRFS